MVKIIADTTSSLPVAVAKARKIYYLPQIIIFGNESYRDDTEIDTPTFLSKLRASAELPKTAAPPPALYTPIFQELVQNGESAIVIAPSAEVSGTARSASVAAQDFPNADIRVIDTQTIGSGLGSIVLKAQEWADAGLDVDTIEAKVKELSACQRVFFLVDTLEYLYKGGRIGGASALFGSILQVKPILTIVKGRAEAVETQRTKRRALGRLVEIVKQDCPTRDECLLTIMASDAEDVADGLAADLTAAVGVENIPVYKLPPAILVHAGPKTVAVSYFVAVNHDGVTK
jgi:DegV family protein with EDD domain